MFAGLVPLPCGTLVLCIKCHFFERHQKKLSLLYFSLASSPWLQVEWDFTQTWQCHKSGHQVPEKIHTVHPIHPPDQKGTTKSQNCCSCFFLSARQRKRHRERLRPSFLLLIHSPSAHNSFGWEIRCQDFNPGLWHVWKKKFYVFPGICICRKLESGVGPGLELRHFDMGRMCFKWRHIFLKVSVRHIHTTREKERSFTTGSLSKCPEQPKRNPAKARGLFGSPIRVTANQRVGLCSTASTVYISRMLESRAAARNRTVALRRGCPNRQLNSLSKAQLPSRISTTVPNASSKRWTLNH